MSEDLFLNFTRNTSGQLFSDLSMAKDLASRLLGKDLEEAAQSIAKAADQ